MGKRWKRWNEVSKRGRRPVRVTMGHAARSYTPTSPADFFFLRGLALVAARHALREDEKLYVPREWEGSGS
jgi:hypothetical protein